MAGLSQANGRKLYNIKSFSAKAELDFSMQLSKEPYKYDTRAREGYTIGVPSKAIKFDSFSSRCYCKRIELQLLLQQQSTCFEEHALALSSYVKQLVYARFVAIRPFVEVSSLCIIYDTSIVFYPALY